MITRRVRVQVTAFVVVALVGIGYTGFRYAGLERLFGYDGYQVKVQLAESGGIFANADVTYRGITVGRVGQLHITGYGTEVDLQIAQDAPPIPVSAKAVVANRSAIGEQYVDLQPDRPDGPYLAAGSTITMKNTKTPIPVETILFNLNQLAESVPTGSLRTVVTELGTAFQGTSQDLKTILETTNSFVATAAEHLPQTVDLLAQARTVLDTQNAESGNIRSFGRDLHTLAAQLKSSDPDLRRLIDSAPKAAGQISGLLAESGPNLGIVLANLLTTSTVLMARTSGVEQILVSYPVLTSLVPTVLPGDGTAHLGLVLNFFDPLACTKGYGGTNLRPASDTTSRPFNAGAYCAEPPGSPTSVRGAQNTPFAGQPVSVPAPGDSGRPSTASPALPGVLGLPGLGKGPAGLAGLLGLPG
jgi:phospholipid/cholesterol/gamma-HCH transport system substrate-binding protein